MQQRHKKQEENEEEKEEEEEEEEEKEEDGGKEKGDQHNGIKHLPSSNVGRKEGRSKKKKKNLKPSWTSSTVLLQGETIYYHFFIGNVCHTKNDDFLKMDKSVTTFDDLP